MMALFTFCNLFGGWSATLVKYVANYYGKDAVVSTKKVTLSGVKREESAVLLLSRYQASLLSL